MAPSALNSNCKTIALFLGNTEDLYTLRNSCVRTHCKIIALSLENPTIG